MAVEHPHDKRPCVVCEATPVLLNPSAQAEVGLCARCHAPYIFKEGALILPKFESAIPVELLDLARAAWGQKIRIDFAPFVVDDTTAPTAFEAFVEKHGQADLAASLEGEAAIASVEVWTVLETNQGLGWLRVLPTLEPDEGVEFGTIALDADELPPGTTITINRPGAEA